MGVQLFSVGLSRRSKETFAFLALVYLLFIVGSIEAQLLADLPNSIILCGKVITPNGVIDHGYVVTSNCSIRSVTRNEPALPDSITVPVNGIISPGFIDLHNHVPWNVLPRWKSCRLFTNRNQWRNDTDYKAKVEEPFAALNPTHFADMNRWGELRGLVGGTTSILATQDREGIEGLLRNLDWNSGFYPEPPERIVNILELPSNPLARAIFVQQAQFAIQNPLFEALVIHLAEGTDAAAKEEFTFVRDNNLLNPKGVIIHGIPLTKQDFAVFNGTGLVWSPRSNVQLYGKTADVLSALKAGVEVALAPDWAITGSSNMLDELRYAAQWNRKKLCGKLTNRQLFEMATSVAARIAGIEDEVGSIQEDLRADLVVFQSRCKDAYASIVSSSVTDIRLVMIKGIPLYGTRSLMERFWNPSNLEEIILPGGVKMFLVIQAGDPTVRELAARLQQALKAEGTKLAPLAEPTSYMTC